MDNGFNYIMQHKDKKSKSYSRNKYSKSNDSYEGKLIQYFDNYYIITSVIPSTNKITFIIKNVENENDKRQINSDDKNIINLSNDDSNKIEKALVFVDKYNKCVQKLHSISKENDEFELTNIYFIIELIDKKKCGITFTQLENILRHLRVSQLPHFEIHNICKNPFSFIQQDIQIISYEKAEKICELYDINIPFEIKCKKWSFDFIRVFNCFYVESRRFWDNFHTYCDNNSKNYEKYCTIVNEVIIDKVIDGRYYKTTNYLFNLEKSMGDTMMNLYHDKKYNISIDFIKEKIQLFEETSGDGFKLEIEQVNAVINSILYKFNCITGYPGTGKSTIVKCILFVFKSIYQKEDENILPHIPVAYPVANISSDLYAFTEAQLCTKENVDEGESESEISFREEQELALIPNQDESHQLEVYTKDECKYVESSKISILAPTGLAYLGLKNKCDTSTNKQFFNKNISGTCHRIIYRLFQNIDKDKDKNDFPKLIIIDEVSMLDTFMFQEILKYCQLFNCRLLLFGDENQLPSIGPGCILKNIILSTLFNHDSLLHIKRQDKCGILSKNIKKMNESKVTIDDFSDNSMVFADIKTFENEKESIVKLCSKYNLNKENTKFLTYFNKKTYKFNVSDLNKSLQSIFNEDNKEIFPNFKYQAEKYVFKEGDKIVRTLNSYAKGDDVRANGEMAQIVHYDYNKNKITIVYSEDNVEVKISKTELYDEFELAYALTIHKSQGSQFDNVVIFIDVNQNSWDKTALYTAISRAKKRCIVVAKYENFLKVQNNRRAIDDKVSLFLKEFNEYEVE